MRGICSALKDEIVHVSDAARGPEDAVALKPAVPQDLPILHPGENMLDPGSDPPVGGIMLLLPVRQTVLVPLPA